MLIITDHDIINSQPAAGRQSALHAYLNATGRSRSAIKANPDFFENPLHQARVDAVRGIVEDFFGDTGTIYVTHRGGWSRPFTAVKVQRPSFPRVSQADKERLYLKPLRDLGVAPVFSKQTNSYLYRVY
jgi:hypothetical protein